MRHILRAFFIIAITFSAGNQLQAECNPETDPCAPQKVLNAWQKSLALGFNMTSGNSDTTLFTFLGDIYREKKKSIWDIDMAYSFGEDKNRLVDETQDDLGDTTRNDFRSSAVYKYLLNDRSYTGLENNVLYDEVADVDYRVSLIPTVGHYFLKDADYQLYFDLGPGYVFEKVGGIDDDYIAPKIGEGFTWTISCTSKIYQKAGVIFDVNNSDNYLLNAELGIESALSSSLSLVFLARETYDNEPAEGLEKEDLQVISALKVAL